MKATFENSVNVLVKAYLNDTLCRMSGCACAVGNLLQAVGDHGPAWWGPYVRSHFDLHDLHKDKALQQIEKIGYTVDQVRRIEQAFMGWGEWRNMSQDIFDGLIRVVDVLAEIHNVDLTVKESAKLLFVK